MESLADKHKAAVRSYLEDWVAYHPDQQTGIPLTIIEDSSHGHFLLMETGWGSDGWVNRVFVHFRVNDSGKVILLKNHTTEEPLEELVEKGISKADFLVAWQEPSLVKSLFGQKAA